VVVHPDREAVLVARRDGAVRLPEAEQPGQVWTADPAEVLPGLRDLLGAAAVLLRCLEEDEDPAARVQRVTLATRWPGRRAASRRSSSRSRPGWSSSSSRASGPA
jgi:hypothetical protein